jgi:hypothetical protein
MPLSQTKLFNTWEEYYPKVYGYFLRRVNNHTDVEDLTCKISSPIYKN